jgi:hypothetical protein
MCHAESLTAPRSSSRMRCQACGRASCDTGVRAPPRRARGCLFGETAPTEGRRGGEYSNGLGAGRGVPWACRQRARKTRTKPSGAAPTLSSAPSQASVDGCRQTVHGPVHERRRGRRGRVGYPSPPP